MRIVAALGGNALARRGEPIDAATQRSNAAAAARALAPLLDRHEVTITHGNGPQVGMLLLESEADPQVAAYPLDVLGAESEGMIGYLLEQALLRERPRRRVATVLTQTVVDGGDPAFAAPAKPIGPLYDESTARRLERERGFAVRPDTGGWRRVVASPEPRQMLEGEVLATLVAAGVTVIAAGGGGVPVVLDDAGRPRGVEAVVDKDLVAALLARQLKADVLLLLTDVDAVYRGFGGDDPRPLSALDPDEAARLIAAGEAGAGSMAPKLVAAARFARGGGRAMIASLDGAAAALVGEGGTTVSLDGAAGPGVRRPLTAARPELPASRA